MFITPTPSLTRNSSQLQSYDPVLGLQNDIWPTSNILPNTLARFLLSMLLSYFISLRSKCNFLITFLSTSVQGLSVTRISSQV